MQFIKFILVGILLHSCISEPLKCATCAQKKADLTVEELRLLRYEYIKNQILKKLHLTEAPKTNLPKPSLKSLLAIAELAENETDLDSDNTDSVVIYTKNENLTCSGNRTSPCYRFEFEIPESVSLENFSSADVWFYKKRTEDIRVYQVIKDSMQNVISFELENVAYKSSISWVKYSILSHSFNSDFATDRILVLEVTCSQLANHDSAIATTGDDTPFLVVRSMKDGELSRRRRSTSCAENRSSCCKENFFLNFSEIGWDNWILHPDGYQANFCRGRCLNDLSDSRFYHSTVLLSYIRDNKDIAEEIGLSMCCTPSVMAPVAIIYRNEEGLIYHKSIENMKVEACDCA